MAERLYHVSISPHLREKTTVPLIMWTVFVALLPQLALATWIFGPRVLLLTAVAVVTAVVAEAAFQKLRKQAITIKDGSAALTGLLLAYVLPPGVSLDIPFWGSIFAICIAKQLFGGLGFNFFNPALISRAFLALGFPLAMTTAWIMPFAWSSGADAVSTATPLYVLKTFGISGLYEQYGDFATVAKSFFIGIQPGCIGETSSLLLVAGGLFLLWRKIISWHIPVSMLVSVAVLAWIFGGEGYFTGNPLVHLLSGGLMLGAFFMATDYVTSPTQPVAKLIFGAGIGALTVLIRLKGGYPEGVCYAILLMNALAPVLEDWIRPKRFALPQTEPKKR